MSVIRALPFWPGFRFGLFFLGLPSWGTILCPIGSEVDRQSYLQTSENISNIRDGVCNYDVFLVDLYVSTVLFMLSFSELNGFIRRQGREEKSREWDLSCRFSNFKFTSSFWAILRIHNTTGRSNSSDFSALWANKSMKQKDWYLLLFSRPSTSFNAGLSAQSNTDFPQSGEMRSSDCRSPTWNRSAIRPKLRLPKHSKTY